MSTLRVDNIRHNNATSDAITLASDGTAKVKPNSIGFGTNTTTGRNAGLGTAQGTIIFLSLIHI